MIVGARFRAKNPINWQKRKGTVCLNPDFRASIIAYPFMGLPDFDGIWGRWEATRISPGQPKKLLEKSAP